MRGSLLLIAAFACVATSSCKEAQSEASDPMAEYRINWATLKDGSQWAKFRNGANSGVSKAIRCWPPAKTSLNTYTCISVTELTVGAHYLSVKLALLDEPPRNIFSLVDNGDGYTCSTMMGYHELIEKHGETLVSNRPDYDTAPWRKSFVQKYMNDNDVSGTSHFNCLGIAEVIQRGSLASIGTTSISYEMIGR